MGDVVKFRKIAVRERKPRRLMPEVLTELLMVHSSCVMDQQERCPLLLSVRSLCWEINQFCNIASEEDRGFRRVSEMQAAQPGTESWNASAKRRTTMDMFDEIDETKIGEDGKLEASLVPDAEQDMEASVADLKRRWKDFKAANGDQYPVAVWTYDWWKALVYLALAEDHLKEQFLGRDRSPASLKQYHRWRLSLCDGRPFRTNA